MAEEFEGFAQLRAWLVANRGAPELWVRLRRGGPVTWEDCVRAALCVGWIDAAKRGETETTWLQRLVPRRRGSTWSRRNREHALRLIADGLMEQAGLAEVEAARADGRWDAAYAGQRDMAIPDDFLLALEGRPVAQATFQGLNRANLYAIYHRLHTARTPATRAARMDKLLATLDRGERFH